MEKLEVKLEEFQSEQQPNKSLWIKKCGPLFNDKQPRTSATPLQKQYLPLSNTEAPAFQDAVEHGEIPPLAVTPAGPHDLSPFNKGELPVLWEKTLTHGCDELKVFLS